MEIALTAVGLLMIVATVLPFSRRDSWWIRIFDFPRAQITVIGAVVLMAYFVFVADLRIARLSFVAALSLCIFYQAYMMFPYTPLARKQVQKSSNAIPESTLSLLFANVLMTNRKANKLKQIIRSIDPDIILTAETDEWWQEKLRTFESTHPYTIQQPQDNTYGMTLYSRLELVDPKVRYLIDDDVPSFHATVRLRSGIEVELRCLHPRPPFPTEDLTATGRDAELLIVGRESKIKELPFVVIGDLNDVAWSRTNYLFQDISGLLDPRIGRGFYNTFHAKLPFIRFPLDHFFHSNHFRLVDFRRLPAFGSDHFPVYIKLSYEPDAPAVQKEPDAEPEEVEEAAKKIGKALADKKVSP